MSAEPTNCFHKSGEHGRNVGNVCPGLWNMQTRHVRTHQANVLGQPGPRAERADRPEGHFSMTTRMSHVHVRAHELRLTSRNLWWCWCVDTLRASGSPSASRCSPCIQTCIRGTNTCDGASDLGHWSKESRSIGTDYAGMVPGACAPSALVCLSRRSSFPARSSWQMIGCPATCTAPSERAPGPE